MPGYAQRLFAERGHGPLPKGKPVYPLWPLLEACVEAKLLPYVDFCLARALLANSACQSEPAAALICHLSHSARQGHLCIQVNGLTVDPDPRLSWLAEIRSAEDVPAEAQALLESVHQYILDGIHACGQVEFIRSHASLYYLQKFWTLEEIFLSSLKRMMEGQPKFLLDEIFLHSRLDAFTQEGILLPAQAKAAEVLSRHRLTILCGGPGTGKTYTAGLLIKLIWDSLSPAQKPAFEIALAAPTGKAAANLQASLQRSTEAIQGFPAIQARTLHALLGIKRKKSAIDIERRLSADLVIVDETSMADAHLMAALFSAMKPGSRLILLGDPYQLPPVEAGGLFANLLEFFRAEGHPCLVELTQCVRTDSPELVLFAEALKAGDKLGAKAHLLAGQEGAIGRLPAALNLPAHIVDFAKPYFQVRSGAEGHALLSKFNSFRILSPLRKGPWGVEELNSLFVKALNSNSRPIILMQNDHKLDLYNGESGVLVRDHSGEYAIFPARAPGQAPRRFPEHILPKYEYAYCLSVHKSQGSEYEHVLILIPPGAEIFGREVFYTAATRARRRLDVWGEDEVIEKTLANQSRRLSGVSLKLGA